jgi:UDP-glucose 4-epimerase
MNFKSIFITGGAGFIGTNLIKRLLKDNYEVVSIDNYSTGLRENERQGCKYIDGDIIDTDNLEQILNQENPDGIFHLAALARIQPSLKDPHKTIFNNFVGNSNVFWCSSCKIELDRDYQAARNILIKNTAGSIIISH